MGTVLRPLFLALVAASFLGASWLDDESLTFEVASVKPAQGGVRKGSMHGGPGTDSPGQITVTSLSLERLILAAYSLRDDQYKGPEWMKSEMFDIVAKVPPGTSSEQARAMMRNLLEARFQMVSHHEAIARTAYDLTVTKGGPKMKDSPKSDTDKFMGMVGGTLTVGPDGFPELPADYVRTLGAVTVPGRGISKTVAARESMEKFAVYLTRELHRPVFDKTNLSGLYEFSFTWVSDNVATTESGSPSSTALPAGPVGRSIFQALEKELGLQLVKKTATVDTLMIDHVERKPLGN